jgi:hypothetical protein
MIPSRRSQADRQNPSLQEVSPPPRKPSLDEWVRKVAGPGGRVDGTLLLVGGSDLLHFRLRIAQSHAREDLAPSFWSHVGIVAGEGRRLRLHEVPLDPPAGFRDMPRSNGVQAGSLRRYEDAQRFPNVAILSFPVVRDEVDRAIARVRQDRGLLDLTAPILSWLGFAWGAGSPANPLIGGTGIPAAMFAEAVFAALGLELTPGLATRSSCPEAIWQAARWWHGFYADRAPVEAEEASPSGAPPFPSGYYWIGQPAATFVEPPRPRRRPRRVRRRQ